MISHPDPSIAGSTQRMSSEDAAKASDVSIAWEGSNAPTSRSGRVPVFFPRPRFGFTAKETRIVARVWW